MALFETNTSLELFMERFFEVEYGPESLARCAEYSLLRNLLVDHGHIGRIAESHLASKARAIANALPKTIAEPIPHGSYTEGLIQFGFHRYDGQNGTLSVVRRVMSHGLDVTVTDYDFHMLADGLPVVFEFTTADVRRHRGQATGGIQNAWRHTLPLRKHFKTDSVGFVLVSYLDDSVEEDPHFITRLIEEGGYVLTVPYSHDDFKKAATSELERRINSRIRAAETQRF